ncbi:THAP domain-containing protein 1-like [Mya arenaria]|uniref:THAP domain-containing protein 1-like n=1 Tax=Mya arenaria TaxID=6604 RepID=UPI0022E2AB2F|nr:THAP domain-containing protein 1-like [Mya arenaria]
MVKSCSVFGGTHRANSVAKKKGIRFFKFPKGSHKRRSWIKAMNRKDWIPNGNSFVCSAHFVYGWHSYEAGDADYAPSVFSYKETAVDEKRQERAFRRDISMTFEAAAKAHKEREDSILHISTAMHTYCGDGKSDVDEVVQTGMQCDTDSLIEENQQLREENERLRKELKMMKWGVNIIKDDDNTTRFYSGQKNAIFEWRQNPSEVQAEATKFKFDFD